MKTIVVQKDVGLFKTKLETIAVFNTDGGDDLESYLRMIHAGDTNICVSSCDNQCCDCGWFVCIKR